MSKKIIIIGIAIALIAVSAAIYIYYGLLADARNIKTESPAFSISATQLSADYVKDFHKADSLYLNKTVAIKGTVVKVTDSVIMLEKNIFCLLEESATPALLNKKIIIKGKCIGYDELFEEIKLDQCTIIE